MTVNQRDVVVVLRNPIPVGPIGKDTEMTMLDDKHSWGGGTGCCGGNCKKASQES